MNGAGAIAAKRYAAFSAQLDAPRRRQDELNLIWQVWKAGQRRKMPGQGELQLKRLFFKKFCAIAQNVAIGGVRA